MSTLGGSNTQACCVSIVTFTLEVMNSSLLSMSGVRRQARNLRDVREVRSCKRPADTIKQTSQLQTEVTSTPERVQLG